MPPCHFLRASSTLPCRHDVFSTGRCRLIAAIFDAATLLRHAIRHAMRPPLAATLAITTEMMSRASGAFARDDTCWRQQKSVTRRVRYGRLRRRYAA